MTPTTDTMLVDIRANTQGFANDISAMRNTFDGTLVAGFNTAGSVLEKGLAGALAKGNAGFLDLGKVATQVIDKIAMRAIDGLFGSLGGGGSGGGALGGLGSLFGAILGLPGRATGGPVSPGQGYLVGERGPELFVPTSAGAIVPNGGGSAPQPVNVAITIAAPAGTGAPQALQRSSRQVASAVRRALSQY